MRHEISTLLTMLALMDERRVSAPYLTERLGVSVATFKRILDSARCLGLRIVWRRRDGSIGRGPHGWYDVQAWGVFDAREVRAWYRRRKK